MRPKKGFSGGISSSPAHGKAYNAIKARNPAAKVGIANASQQFRNLTGDEASQAFCDYAVAENNGIFLDPVVFGAYPQVVLDHLGADAPIIEQDDLRVMNRCDFLGVQYYCDNLVADGVAPALGPRIPASFIRLHGDGLAGDAPRSFRSPDVSQRSLPCQGGRG